LTTLIWVILIWATLIVDTDGRYLTHHETGRTGDGTGVSQACDPGRERLAGGSRRG
jgi:hypothetical protein